MNMEHLRNNPDYHRRLLAEWRKLLRGEMVDPRIVREPIYSSWIRSRGWKVDPEQELVHSIPQEELDLLLEEESQLLDITTPVMMQLVDILGKTGNSLVLANARGIVLKVFNSDERARPRPVKPGDFKREALLGTAVRPCRYGNPWKWWRKNITAACGITIPAWRLRFSIRGEGCSAR